MFRIISVILIIIIVISIIIIIYNSIVVFDVHLFINRFSCVVVVAVVVRAKLQHIHRESETQAESLLSVSVYTKLCTMLMTTPNICAFRNRNAQRAPAQTAHRQQTDSAPSRSESQVIIMLFCAAPCARNAVAKVNHHRQ